MFLQPVPHAVTVLVQGGVEQPHPLLQALQCVLHQALLLSSAQPACSSTQKLSAQVYLPGHCLQLFIQTLEKRAEVSNIASRFLIICMNVSWTSCFSSFYSTSRFVSCVSVSSDSSTGPESSWFSAESNQEEAAETAAYRSCWTVCPISLLSPFSACEDKQWLVFSAFTVVSKNAFVCN